MVEYLLPERRVETCLAESRIGLNLENANEPAPFVVEKGYVMLRPDGSDTGLVLTPNLKAERGRMVRPKFKRIPANGGSPTFPAAGR